MPKPCEVRTFTIAPATPLTLRAPFNCHTVRIEQTDLVNAARIEMPDAKAIPAGTEVVFAHPASDRMAVSGWAEGDVIGDVYSTAGTGPVTVTFLGFK